MTGQFKEVGNSGYIKHNGGLLFRQVRASEYQFRVVVREFHLNSSGTTHGGFIMTLLDTGMGTSAFRFLGGDKRIATISLDVNFIGPSFAGHVLTGAATIIRKTRSLIFVRGELQRNENIIATADGVWKILSQK